MFMRVYNWNRIKESARVYPIRTIEAGFWHVVREDFTLQRLASNADVMGTLFSVFRTAVQDAAADKAYYLSKLAEYNKISNALLDYLNYLISVSEDLNSGPYKCSSKDQPNSWMPTRMLVPRPLPTQHSTGKPVGKIR